MNFGNRWIARTLAVVSLTCLSLRLPAATLINGDHHYGMVFSNSIDTWTFTANAGDSIIIRANDESFDPSHNTFNPSVELYGPDGALLDSDSDEQVVEFFTRATNNGIFVLTIHDNGSDSGLYRISLAKTGSPFVIPGGDEGGPMTNGYLHRGYLDLGELNIWTFSANIGDRITLRMGPWQLTRSNVLSLIRVFGPDGACAHSCSNCNDEVYERSFTATNSGTFTTVVCDGGLRTSGTGDYFGNYDLTLANSRNAVVVSPGDEGGTLIAGTTTNGTIHLGDMDLWTFVASASNSIKITVTELSDTNSFGPELRLFDPTGILVKTVDGDTSANISMLASNSGRYLLIVADHGSTQLTGSGRYQLSVSGITGPAVIANVITSGTNFVFGGSGGGSNGFYFVLASTNVALPVTSWKAILTNRFDASGNFRVTNFVDPAIPQRFFTLAVP